MRRATLITFTLALLLGLAALSVAAEEEGGQADRVEVGEQAPTFSLSTTDGATLSLASLQGDTPVVLTFFRGTWWPYCRQQLGELQAGVDEIRQRGAELWVLSPDQAKKLRKFQQKEGLDFPVLLDSDNQVSASYGLINESNPVVPHPTTVIIDRQGVIRYLRVDVDYKVRPTVDELLKALDQLQQ